MKLSFQVTEPSPDKKRNLPPVVLIHGRFDSKKTWRHLAPKIAENTGRKVFYIDQRNHGESPWSVEMNFDVLTQDLENFLTEQKIEKALLVGHSMGGRVAMFFSLKKPEMVEKLVIEDMVTGNYSSLAKISVLQIFTLLQKSVSVIPKDADENTAKRAIIEYFKSQMPADMYQRKKNKIFDLETIPLKKEGNEYKWQANMQVLEEMIHSEKNNKSLAGRYDGDVLFLYGTESYFDVGNEDASKLFPKAVKIPIQGAGHLIHQDCPDEFLQPVIKFINSDISS